MSSELTQADIDALNDRYVEGAFQTTITAIAIHRAGDSPIFGESTTIVRLDDEGGGPFVVIEQADASQSGAIRLDPDECEIVMREVGRLLEQKAIERKPEV